MENHKASSIKTMDTGGGKNAVIPDSGSVGSKGVAESGRGRRRRPLSHLGVSGDLPFPIPKVKTDLTPEWLQKVFRANKIIPPELSIRGAKIEPGDHGFHSDIFRIELVYNESEAAIEEASARFEGEIPRVVVSKLWVQHAAPIVPVFILKEFWQVECEYYNQGVPGYETIDCFFAAQREATGCILLKEISWEVASSSVPLTKDQALGAVEELARFHASTWQKPYKAAPYVPRFDSVVRKLAAKAMVSSNFESLLGCEQFAKVHEHIRLFSTRIKAMFTSEILLRQPLVAVHGDWRSDNLFFEDNVGVRGVRRCRCIDFQQMAVTNPMLDMATMLMTNLDVDDRRKWEGELFVAYIAELERLGISSYTVERAKADARLMKLWPLTTWIMTGNSIVERYARVEQKKKDGKGLTEHERVTEEKSLEMRERMIAAVTDDDLISVIRSLDEDWPLPVVPCCCYWAW